MPVAGGSVPSRSSTVQSSKWKSQPAKAMPPQRPKLLGIWPSISSISEPASCVLTSPITASIASAVRSTVPLAGTLTLSESSTLDPAYAMPWVKLGLLYMRQASQLRGAKDEANARARGHRHRAADGCETLKFDRFLRGLRDDERYRALLAKMKLDGDPPASAR